MASTQGNRGTEERSEQSVVLVKETGPQSDSMSCSKEEWTQREGPCLMLTLPKALNEAGEGGLSEPRASHDILLGPCSSTVEWVERGRDALNMENQ